MPPGTLTPATVLGSLGITVRGNLHCLRCWWASIHRHREVLKKAGVFHLATIKRDVHRPDRARIATNPEGMSHEELLEHYFISREVPEERRALLMEAAHEIIKPEAAQV